MKGLYILCLQHCAVSSTAINTAISMIEDDFQMCQLAEALNALSTYNGIAIRKANPHMNILELGCKHICIILNVVGLITLQNVSFLLMDNMYI